MRELYRPLFIFETPIVITNVESSEMIKYASNAYLAVKISFINEIADLCERVGANVQDVARGMGLDGRIGRKFLHAGPGYGGSCFPKDTVALARTAQEHGSPLRIVETVINVNDTRKGAMAARVIAACGGSVRGKSIAVLGVAFKPNTDDMRAAPSLSIIPAMEEAARLLGDVTWCDGPYETAAAADALVLLTEWNEYRALDLERLGAAMAERVLVDLRNVYSPVSARQAGFRYASIGRQA
jgi:UDPglucose 6-dehydrogenase